MRSSANVAVQVGALVAFGILRLASPGWLLIIMIMSVVGLLLPAVPAALSLVALRRRVLRPALAVPFLVSAGLLLVAGATMPDVDDVDSNLALWTLVAGPGVPIPDVFGVVGTVAGFGYLVSILWLVVAFAMTAARPPAPAYGQGWQQPVAPCPAPPVPGLPGDPAVSRRPAPGSGG